MTPASPKHIADGFRSLEAGMNGGVSPLQIPPNQYAYGDNCAVRGSFIKARPKWRRINVVVNTGLDADVLEGLFQGACYYKPDSGNESLMASIAGYLYRFQFTSETNVYMTDQTNADPNDAATTIAWLWQSERWAIWSDGINLPVFWDGSAAGTSIRRSTGDTTTPAELPVCRMGCYGRGRNWVALPDGRSFIAGDIVNWSSGTSTYDFRDAVLKASANQLISGGGSFVVPGNVDDITAMRFVATLDASLGQGPLQVLTPDTVFSCNAPVDQSTWQFVTSPILTESLIGFGGMGQNSTIVVNGDLMFRSVEGIRSLILARRDFTAWGNSPISTEVGDQIASDDQSLLRNGSAIQFDNRMIMTANPVLGEGGVYHDTLVSMDLNPVSSLRGKQPPVYDGIWTDKNVLQLIRGRVMGVERAFAFVWDDEIQLWELLPDGTAGSESITWEFHTAALFKEDQGGRKTIFDPCRLVDGEIYVDSIEGSTAFTAYYRPDYETTWQAWHNWTVDGTKPYAVRMGLGEPSVASNPTTGLPYREGYSFQVKFVIQGACRILGAKFQAVVIPDAQFSKPLTT